jgi:gamma-glutamyltranspeptidase/glutathione hydrolase
LDDSRDIKKGELALAVATSEPLANQAAAEIFKKGGNIVDAAVAASFAISVIRPQSTGIGGGGFLIYKRGRLPADVFDFREVAGRLASPDMYMREGKLRSDLSLNGPLAVAVPGLVAGLAEFHQGRGKLTWLEVLQPAINLALRGVPVSKHMANAIKVRWAIIEKDPELKRLLSKDGEPLEEGDVLVQKDLAQTLKRIAERGRQEFYRGATAKMLVDYMEKNGGILTLRDLARYRVRKREPLRGAWRRYALVTMPPPSSGGLHLLQILSMTDKLGLPKTAGVSYSKDPELNKAILGIVLEKLIPIQFRQSYRADEIFDRNGTIA